MSELPVTNECPYCREPMQVRRMECGRCRVAVDATFPASRLGNLPTEHQRFIEMFVLAGGNLKEIAEQTGVSYPTIRSRLLKIIDILRAEIGKTSVTRGSLLDAFEDEPSAAELIKSI